jgi:hypothetical protein
MSRAYFLSRFILKFRESAALLQETGGNCGNTFAATSETQAIGCGSGDAH